MAIDPQNDAVTGLLLVGHGTRSELGRRQFLMLAERLKMAVAPAAVEASFLELAEPTIDEALGRLVERGIERLVTMPLLLFAAGHAKDNVPRAVGEALARRGQGAMKRVQAGHLGCHAAILELSQRRLDQLTGQPMPEGTVLLLVGRGSRDEAATAEMQRFAQLRAERSGLETEVAFLAMARPLLREQLAALAARAPRSVVVQPHLLFHGDLVDALHAQVADWRSLYPRTRWEVTSLLADSEGDENAGGGLLEAALLDRWQEARIRVATDLGDD